MSAEPWSKFFWSDYDADEGLRMCSLAAQGLWMRMLCLMARANPKGELRVGGEPCTVTDLSRAVGESEEAVTVLLGELDRRGVSSTTRAGVIYSRRLRKDAEISRKRAKSGALGAAVTNRKMQNNPDLPQQTPGKPSGKEAAPEARSHIPEEVRTPKPPGLPTAVRAVMEAGGYVTPPGDIGLLQQWRDAGAELEGDILAVIRREAATLRSRTGQAPRTLKVFDGAIREKLATDEREIERLRGVTARYGGEPQIAAGGR